MFCTKCGYNMGDNAVCPNCGNEVKKSPVFNNQTAQNPTQNTNAVNNSTQIDFGAQPVKPQQSGTFAPQNDMAQQMNSTVAQPNNMGQQLNNTAAQPNNMGQQLNNTAAQPNNMGQQLNNNAAQSNNMGQQLNNTTAQSNATLRQPVFMGQQPGNTASQPNLNGQMNFGAQMNNGQMPVGDIPKKKKKWPIVTSIVVAIVLILGVGTYFAYPYIKSAFSPNKEVVKALKNTGNDLEDALTGYVEKSGDSKISTTGITNMEGWLTINKMTYNGKSLMSSFSVDTLKIDAQLDSDTNEASGTIGFAKGNTDSVLDMNYYVYDDVMYFNLPKLFTESFKTDVEKTTSSKVPDYLDGLYSSSSKNLSGMDLSQLKQYSGLINSVTKDILKGYDELIDNCEYDKVGEETLSTNNGDIKTTKYNVTVNEEALGKAIDATVDALYDDSEVSSYLSLATTYLGKSKDDIKTQAKKAIKGMNPVTIAVYVNDSEKVVKYELDLSSSGLSSDNIKASISFTGKESIYNGIQIEMSDNDVKLNFDFLCENKVAKFNMLMVENEGKHNEEKIQMVLDMTSDNNKVVLNELSIVVNDGTESVEMAMKGEIQSSEGSSLSVKKSDFSNPIDVQSITTEQKTNLYQELYNHLDVLEKIYSGFDTSTYGGSGYDSNGGSYDYFDDNYFDSF